MLDLLRPEHAYLLGFLMGDGSLYAGRGLKGRLSIELNRRDEDLLHALAPLLPGALLSQRRRRTNFSHDSHTSVLTWCRLDVRRAVASAGLPSGRKDELIRPPSGPLSVRDFARGLVDADGSVGFTRGGIPFLSLVTKSQPMAWWWTQVLLDTAGARRTARPNRRDGVANVMVQAEPAVAVVGWLYQDGDLALSRKREAATRVVQWRRPEGMRARSRPRRWTDAEDLRVVADRPVAALAEELDRTPASVVARRWRLRRET